MKRRTYYSKPRRKKKKRVFDANEYAIKKTVAQGMLDIALLASNASQLKYVLQFGPIHEFYTLLIALITISIILQTLSFILTGIMFCFIGGDPRTRKVAIWLYRVNIVWLSLVLYCDVINISFGLDTTDYENYHRWDELKLTTEQ
ncbi:hypothetical protein O3G_MSEX008889 [Manduca sexta]|uniref:Uncharacterized protein n=1 Tax=Manduca sexta TaxID=7130 RepID=A0A921ZBG1_MANSE|nr:hypothetical protein O3G_MSEX008889 [Manduca sexta]